MPPRRKAAAPPAPLPLDGCAIALSGKFDSLGGHTQGSLEALIRTLGGTVTRSVTKTTTHVVCSEDDYKGNSAKVSAGKAKDLPLVSPIWILDSDEEKKTLDPETYSWFQKSVASASSQTKPAAGSKKRPTAAAAKTAEESEEEKEEEEEEEAPKPKRSKKASSAKSAPAKAEVVKEEEEEESNEQSQVAEGQFLKKKDTVVPIDEFCPLTNYLVHIDPDSGLIYDASLNQTNASHNNNKFYRVQIVVDAKSKTYKTWTRWGRVGEMGQNAILGNGTLPDAIKNFEKKFRDKSGLPWEKRGDNPKPGKYAFVERSYNPDSDTDSDDEGDGVDAKAVKKEDKDEQDSEVKPPECTLEPSVKSLMELIFNQQYFQATMTSLNYDANKLPLGKLSKTTITKGFQQLKDLAALMDDPSLAASKWGMSIPEATEQLSNTYYSVIPHAFGRNRPPIIRDNAMLKKEIELLESLSDMKEAAEIMKLVDRNKSVSTVHPLDRQFQGLGLTEMTTLEQDGSEFKLLENYLHGSRGSTHGINYTVQNIFRIERPGEKDRADKYTKNSKIGANRRLLWHGSRCTNFGGILSQGLRIAPPEAPVSGYMFGKGIYLADMSSKSANYCCSYISGGYALLLLCEAKLGDPMQELTTANYNAGSDAKAAGLESTLGMGTTAPSKWMDAGKVHKSLKGIQMPDADTSPGPTSVTGAGLCYNEYICYNVDQVRLRYLFHVKM